MGIEQIYTFNSQQIIKKNKLIKEIMTNQGKYTN